MSAELRKTGIDVVGDIPWGTHFCHFYETKEDLLDILLPYFTTGLENDEFCLWVTSDPLDEQEARDALRQAVPEGGRYLARGSIEIVPHSVLLSPHQTSPAGSIEIVPATDWYLRGGSFVREGVINGWNAKLVEALAEGYAGMRVNGNEAWLTEENWKAFSHYEAELDKMLASRRMIVLCSYPLTGARATQILDVVRTHQLAIVRRNRTWEVVETPELKRIKAEINALNEKLEQRVAERTQELAAANKQLRSEIAERRRSEEALSESEAQLQAAIDAADIGLWDWDLVSGRIIWLGNHEKMFGFAPGEFDGTYAGFIKRVHPEDLEELERAVRRAREGGPEYIHEYRVILPDGSIHWIADRGRFVYDEVGQPVRMYGAVLNITEEKQAQEALRQSESDLAEAQQAARVGSWRFDIGTNTVRWSEELYRIFDVEKTSFGGTYEVFLARVHPDDRARVQRVNTEVRSGGEPFEVEYRILTRSGQPNIFARLDMPRRIAQALFRAYSGPLKISPSASWWRSISERPANSCALFPRGSRPPEKRKRRALHGSCMMSWALP